MKRTEYQALHQELELGAVPEIVEDRLRQVYARLPEELPARRQMPVMLRRGLAVMASLVLAVSALLGLNAASPALAEGLPFVGGIFQSLNDLGHAPSVNRRGAQERIAQIAVNMADTITVPAGGPLEEPVTVSLKEVYYDGNFVFAGLEFQLDANGERLTEVWGGGYDILINGVSQIPHEPNGTLSYPSDTGNGFCDISSHFMTRVERGVYTTQRAFRVPDELQGAESLEVELHFDGLQGDGLNDVLNSTDFIFRFTAEKSEVDIREADCQGLEMNGVRLISAYTTPAALCIVAEYPESYVHPSCFATFADGMEIGGLGGTDTDTGAGVRHIGIFSGLSGDEERQVVWRLVDKNGSQQPETVFVIDFAEGTASVGSAEDIKSPPVGDYACGAEAIEALEDGYIVEKYHAAQGKPLLYIASASRWKEHLRVELWQDGDLIDSLSTREQDNGWDRNASYWEYDDSGKVDYEEWKLGYSHWILLMREGYAGLDLSKPVTVRAYNDAGEQVLDEELSLTIKEGSSPGAVQPDALTLS